MKLFCVLGYSAHGEVLCPSCLDYDGRSIVQHYAGDPTVLEESCTYCGRSLLELRMATEAERARATRLIQVEKTRDDNRRPALRFEHRPPETILRELKETGWRWDPVACLWWWPARAPVPIPAALVLPTPCGSPLLDPPTGDRRTRVSLALGGPRHPCVGRAGASRLPVPPTPANQERAPGDFVFFGRPRLRGPLVSMV
jgi:hypothetical protein